MVISFFVASTGLAARLPGPPRPRCSTSRQVGWLRAGNVVVFRRPRDSNIAAGAADHNRCVGDRHLAGEEIKVPIFRHTRGRCHHPEPRGPPTTSSAAWAGEVAIEIAAGTRLLPAAIGAWAAHCRLGSRRSGLFASARSTSFLHRPRAETAPPSPECREHLCEALRFAAEPRCRPFLAALPPPR